MKKIGLIVNPIAGMGGAVGLKGTDGDALVEAIRLGARQTAGQRAVAALRVLEYLASETTVYCLEGGMGEDPARRSGFNVDTIGVPAAGQTSGQDTRQACSLLLDIGVDLLIFVGGDGTARDIESVVGTNLPVVAVPAGVKMQSAVFATSPRAAGRLAREYLCGAVTDCSRLEVMDIDEQAYRENRVSPVLFGYLNVPNIPMLAQGPKTVVTSSRKAMALIAQTVVEGMEEGVFYFLGPGTTTSAIAELLGLNSTLLGVDVVRNRELLATDVGENALLEFVRQGPARVVVTVIGGQGFLFGRGNQQLSARVIEKLGMENLLVVATPEKLASLNGRGLGVDLGKREVEEMFPDYLRVITGFNQFTMHPVSRDKSGNAVP
jgi:predicted polyphosphate/ATP-dependent NAD kinase